MENGIGPGKKQPNGGKIVELRKRIELKQEALAKKAGIPERLLREIERRNHPVKATQITAIATALNTTPDNITLATPGQPPTSSASLLKIRAMRSASELSDMASLADRYEWALKVDPTAGTAADMQRLMMIIHRLASGFASSGLTAGGRPLVPGVTDEYDELPFGVIPRIGRLQELLEDLRKNGVGVLAARYITDEHNSTLEQVLAIRFVPANIEEDVFDIAYFDDEIPF